jgi:hypothetical protein
MAGTGKRESTGIPKNAGDSGTYFRDLVRGLVQILLIVQVGIKV